MPFQIVGKNPAPSEHEGVLIPASDLSLSGLSLSSDFAEDVPLELQRDRLLLGLIDTLTARLADLPPELRLGLSATRPNFQSLNWKFETTFIGFTAFDAPGGIKPLPIPTTGKNAGLGEVTVAEIWPNAKKIAPNIQVSEPGILISSPGLKPYWGGNHSDLSLTGDGRAWLWGLFRWLASPNGAPTRAKGNKSAITGKTVSPGVATRPQINAAAPLNGLTPEQATLGVILTFSASISFALLLSRKEGRSWDVNCIPG